MLKQATVDDDGGGLHGNVLAVAAHHAQQPARCRRRQRRAAPRDQVAHLAGLPARRPVAPKLMHLLR